MIPSFTGSQRQITECWATKFPQQWGPWLARPNPGYRAALLPSRAYVIDYVHLYKINDSTEEPPLVELGVLVGAGV